MNSALPFALIVGIEQFGAKKLAEKLSEKDINVVGVGEWVSGLNEINNFDLISDLSQVEGKFNYIFDFIGEREKWEMKEYQAEKITIISVNNRKKAEKIKEELKEKDFNWRMVEAEGVYGFGMEEEGFLAQAIKLAVQNKNLILPKVEDKFRVLALDDLIEAILRASFLSGTEKESYLIGGKETNSEQVAKVLIDEAKMTRFKVLEEEIKIDEIDEVRLKEAEKKLRWEAKLEFKEGVKESLQYFFSKTDEENRRKKKQQVIKHQSVLVETTDLKAEKEERKRDFEVVVEEVKKEESKKSDEIEPFWKQKKMTLEVEEVSKVKEIKSEEETKVEDYDDNFDQEVVVEKKIKEEEVKEIKVEAKKVRKNIFKEIKWKLYLLISTILLLILPIYWLSSTVLMVKNIKDNLAALENKKYTQMEMGIAKNLKRIKTIDEQIDDWGLNKIEWLRNYQSILKIGQEVLILEKKLIAISQSADLISQGIFKGREINFKVELEKEKEYLIDFQNELGLLLARLNGDYAWMPAKWRMDLQREAEKLKDGREKIDLAIKSFDLLDELLGLDGRERKYLVLLQNEAELRATGGFIGSWAMLTFNKGSLINFEVKDVYEADGQLKGHVEPPIEIKNHLGQANWYLRDANWNPDFVTAAGDIQWFLKEETGQKVDGVIGINLAVIKSILGVTGEINVRDFNEKINKDNLYEEAEYYSESKFFPGSIQKASFLGNLGASLFEEIKEIKVKEQLKLVFALIDLLEKNEIQLAFNNSQAAKSSADLGWSGALYNGKCGQENCFSDYLMVVESNLGVNKINYFIYRNMEQMVEIKDNSVERTLKISYENSAKSNDFPGGSYKNYLRVYLPLDVNISQINLIDGRDNSKSSFSSDEIRIKEVSGRKEVGMLVTIDVMSKKSVEIKYSSANSLLNKNNFSYVSYIQKQSGFGDTNFTSLLSFPKEWQPVEVTPQASVVGGKLLFNQKLDKDIKMGILLSK